MTDLRDARLKRALDHAPDAALRPSEATRNAIKSVASGANLTVSPVPVKGAPQESVWRRVGRWWRGTPARSSHMPWNAALATVVLASLVTLMWFEQPVPPALPDEAPAPAVGQASVVTPAPASVPPAAAVAEAESPPLQDASRARARPERDELAARQRAQPKPQTLAKTDGALSEPKTELAPPPVAPPPVAAAIARREESANAAATARPIESVSQSAENTAAPSRPSSPVPPAAPAAAPVPAAAAPVKALSAQSESRFGALDKEKRRADVGLAGGSRTPATASSADWSDLSVQRSGSPLVLSSTQASRLVALLQIVSLRASEASDPQAPAATRLELSRRGERVATIDLGDRWLRWTPVGTDPRSALIGRASAAQWEAIQDELARLGLRAP